MATSIKNRHQTVWWETLYDKNLADILLENSDPQEAKNTLTFLKNTLHMKPGQYVFDQCCGTGRLTEILAQEHHVIGVDLIPDYIKLAHEKTQSSAIRPELHCEDAMTFSTQTCVDIAINWWTSFGYAQEDEQNLQMLQRAYESLKPDGFYALDFMNVPGLYRHFEQDVMRKVIREDKEITLVRRSRIDFKRDTLLKDWHYFIEGQPHTTHTSEVKLYTPATLVALFTQAGFRNIQLFGDLHSNELSLNSPRCIIVGQR